MDGTIDQAEGRDRIARWLTFCSVLLTESPVNYSRLKDSLALMGERCQAEYPSLMAGEEVTIEPDVFDGRLDDFSDETQREFLNLTGDVLFSGLDGPNRTARTLQEALKTLVAEIARGHLNDSFFRLEEG